MEFLNTLWAFILESAPYLLLGLFLSGLIHELVPMEKIKKWLGAKSLKSVFTASAVGVPIPLCSCSVIPTAVTLRKNGASNAATSSFLISTPESGIDSISLTYALIDLPMTIFRPVAAFTSAFIAGFFQLKYNEFPLAEEEMDKPKSCCPSNTDKKNKFSINSAFKYSFSNLSNDIAGWLTIGLILGACIQFVVPENFFSELSMIQNKVMILLIGIPFYICASASTPIALSLMLKGLSPGSALLFLLVGPATNISNIAVLQKYIGKKGVIINILSIALVGLAFSFIVDYFYLNFFELNLNASLAQHEHASWWENLCGAFLIFLLAKGIYIESIKPKIFKKKSACH